jgi:hypothetical protein
MATDRKDRKPLHPVDAARRFFRFYLWYPQQMARFAPVRLVLFTLLMVSRSLVQPAAFLLLIIGVTKYLNPESQESGMQSTVIKIVSQFGISDEFLGVFLICSACALLVVFAVIHHILIRKTYTFVQYVILRIIDDRYVLLANHPTLNEKSKRMRLDYLYSKAPMNISLNCHLWIEGLGSIVTSIIVISIMLISNFWFTLCLFVLILPLSLLLVPDVRRLKESVIVMRRAKKWMRKASRDIFAQEADDGGGAHDRNLTSDGQYADMIFNAGARRQTKKTMNASLEIIKAVGISVGIMAVLVSSYYTSIGVPESLTLVVLMRTFVYGDSFFFS